MIDTTELKKEAELGEALSRLQNNPDFKLLIVDEYLKEFPAQLTMSLGADNTQYDEAQARIKKAIDGIGSFNNFLNRIRVNGVSAKQTIADIDSGEFVADEEEQY